MQTSKAQLKVQQAILNKFGFYSGKIDGIWGPRSIRAKKDFEASPSFKPGFPNNGMPFPSKGPYPKGITLAAGSGMLTCEGVDEILREAAKAENFQDGNKSSSEKETFEDGVEIVNVDESIDNDLGLDIASADSLTSTENKTNPLRNNSKKKKKNKGRN